MTTDDKDLDKAYNEGLGNMKGYQAHTVISWRRLISISIAIIITIVVVMMGVDLVKKTLIATPPVIKQAPANQARLLAVNPLHYRYKVVFNYYHDYKQANAQAIQLKKKYDIDTYVWKSKKQGVYIVQMGAYTTKALAHEKIAQLAKVKLNAHLWPMSIKSPKPVIAKKRVPASLKKPSQPTLYRYKLVAGIFSDLDKAKRVAKTIKQLSGVNPYLWQTRKKGKSSIYVQVGAYKNEAIATKKLAFFKSKGVKSYLLIKDD